jgi:hypothetical protein
MEPDLVVRMASVTQCAAALAVVLAVGSAGADPFAADTTGAFAADPALLSALDDLLVDPVRLVRGDIDRLRALPWLDAADVDALARALPISEPGALVTRAGWPAAIAARTLPFVRIAPATVNDVAVAVTLRADRDRSELHIGGGPLQAALRTGATPAGWLRVQAGAVRATAGDLRAGSGQGLLLWAQRAGPDVGGAAVRRAAGALPATTRSGIRGAALEWSGTRGRGWGVGGRARDGSARTAIGLERAVAAHRFGLAAARDGGRTGVAAQWSRRSDGARLAAEGVWVAPAALGVAIGLETESRALGCDVRLQATRGRLLDSAGIDAGALRSHALVARAHLARTHWEAELEAAHAWSQQAHGTRMQRSAWAARGAWHAGVHRAGLHIVERRRRTFALAASRESERVARTLAVTGTYRRAVAGAWALRFEARGRGDPERLDRACQVALERDGRAAGLALAVASFLARRTWALPLPGAGPMAVRVRGDGVRMGVATRWTLWGCSLHAATACLLELGSAARARADARFAFSWPR